MDLVSYFNDFLSHIRLPDDLRQECIDAHRELSERLLNDPDISSVVVTTFLQGSYRRSTITKPANGKKPDVDVVAVTNLDPNRWTPAQVQELFCKFLDKFKDYRTSYHRQGRSIGITRGGVELDLVITAAPSETQVAILRSDAVASTYAVEDQTDWKLDPSWPAPRRRTNRGAEAALRKALESADWRSEPLLIPDRDANRWEVTDPIAQIQWTHRKNRDTNGHFVNVVKALKWWREQTSSGGGDHLKGFLIERIVGLHCPNGINDVASGVTSSLEAIRDAYAADAAAGRTPFVPDVGLPQNNVFKRITASEFVAFHRLVSRSAAQCRQALNDPTEAGSADKWREVFGQDFPPPYGGGGGSTSEPNSPRPPRVFTPPSRPATPRKGTFA